MYELFVKGGFVMFLLLGASFITIAVICERALYFFFALRGKKELIKKLEKVLTDSVDVAKTREICLCHKNLISEILCNSLLALEKKPEAIEEILSFEANRAIERLEQHLGWISTIAQAAPLLGLLGTVTGMIKAFMVIESTQGDVNVALLAGGIWEALLTTAFGLIVALPALFAYNFFERKTDKAARFIRDALTRLMAIRQEKKE